jgi:hypothetical protein
MRRIFVIALFLLMSAAIGLSQTAASAGSSSADNSAQNTAANSGDQNAIGQMLIQREQESWARRKAGDASYFQKNIPGDFKGTQADGTKLSQGDLVSRAQSSPMSDYNLSNFNVAFPSADTAVVTYNADYRVMSEDGLLLHQKRQITSRWVRRDGDWANVDNVFKKIQ